MIRKGLRTTLVIGLKDLTLVGREPSVLFFVLLFPVIFGLLFGAIFSGAAGSGRSTVLVVDEAGNEASTHFIEILREPDGVEIENAADRAAAEERVRHGGVAVALVIPAGFGEASPIGASDDAEGSVRLVADASRRAEVGVVSGMVHGAVFRLTAELAQRPGIAEQWLEAGGASPARSSMIAAAMRSAIGAGDNREVSLRPRVTVESVHVVRPSSWELTFPQAAAWALVGCVSGFGASLTSERASGTLQRLRSLPIPGWPILAGKALACFVSAVVVLSALQVVASVGFGSRVTSLVAVGLAVAMSAWAFTGLMMFLASITSSEQGSEGAVRAVLLVLALVGGAGAPLYFMPNWMQVVSSVSPFRWAILAFEGVSYRAFGFADLAVVLGVLGLFGALGFVGALALSSRSARG